MRSSILDGSDRGTGVGRSTFRIASVAKFPIVFMPYARLIPVLFFTNSTRYSQHVYFPFHFKFRYLARYSGVSITFPNIRLRIFTLHYKRYAVLMTMTKHCLATAYLYFHGICSFYLGIRCVDVVFLVRNIILRHVETIVVSVFFSAKAPST